MERGLLMSITRNSPGAFILSIILLCLLTISAAHAAKFGKISDEEWRITAPSEYPEANAVIIFEHAEINVDLESIDIRHHTRIKILTQPGVDEVGEHTIVYFSKLDKIKNLKAHTITPDGKKHKVQKSAKFHKKSGGYTYLTFAFPALEPGCIIEFKYQHLSKRYSRLQPWYFQNNIYTMESSVSLTLAAGFVYDYSNHNMPAIDRRPVIEERRTVMGKLRTFTWKLNNLPPIKNEPYMSAEDDYRSSLRFLIHTYDSRYSHIKFQKTWPEVGGNMEEFFHEYLNKRKEIKKLAAQITDGITDPKKKSTALYEYVINNYKSSYDYMNRWFENEKVETLLREGVGAPEEKNVLLAALHNAAGLQAWPVLISTRDNAKFNPRQADTRGFNYLIVYVQLGEEWTYLDASNSHAPYGLLPARCLTDGGLLVDGEKSELVNIATTPVRSYRSDVTRMYIDSAGAVTCSTQCTLSGYYAAEFAQMFEKSTPEAFLKKHFMGRLGINWNLGEFDCALDTMKRFIVNADFTSDELVERLDNHLIIHPVSFEYRDNPFKSEHRFFPVDFNRTFTYHNIVEIFVADSVVEYILPKDFTSAIRGAKLVRQSVVQDSSVIIAVRLDITDPQFPPSRYNELRSFFELLAQTDQDGLTVTLAGSE